jgi:hypothetical protein
MTGDHAEHQDHHLSGPNKGVLADGRVGVLYLEGDGHFVLTERATGAEHRMRIEPGLLVSWSNSAFTHRVEDASAQFRRSMVGPMAFDKALKTLAWVGTQVEFCAGGELISSGDTLPDTFPSGQDCGYAGCETIPSPTRIVSTQIYAHTLCIKSSTQSQASLTLLTHPFFIYYIWVGQIAGTRILRTRCGKFVCCVFCPDLKTDALYLLACS